MVTRAWPRCCLQHPINCRCAFCVPQRAHASLWVWLCCRVDATKNVRLLLPDMCSSHRAFWRPPLVPGINTGQCGAAESMVDRHGTRFAWVCLLYPSGQATARTGACITDLPWLSLPDGDLSGQKAYPYSFPSHACALSNGLRYTLRTLPTTPPHPTRARTHTPPHTRAVAAPPHTPPTPRANSYRTASSATAGRPRHSAPGTHFHTHAQRSHACTSPPFSALWCVNDAISPGALAALRAGGLDVTLGAVNTLHKRLPPRLLAPTASPLLRGSARTPTTPPLHVCNTTTLAGKRPRASHVTHCIKHACLAHNSPPSAHLLPLQRFRHQRRTRYAARRMRAAPCGRDTHLPARALRCNNAIALRLHPHRHHLHALACPPCGGDRV